MRVKVKDFFFQIILDIEKQEWLLENKNKYVGIFYFWFWICGEWLDVVVDDYFLIRNGNFIYIYLKIWNEFWLVFLEKVYVKQVLFF